MSALEAGKVRVVPYDPSWRRKYATETERIWSATGSLVEDIQHIGSTAVPGMAAKPIIDIAVSVADPACVEALLPPLERLGYVYRGLLLGVDGHHFFRKGDPRQYYLHVFQHDSRMWRERLAFRDYLIGHPAVAAEYGRLKERLAAQYAGDRESYTAGKAEFIEQWTAVALGDQDDGETGAPGAQ